MLCRRNVNLTVKMSHYDRKGTKNSEINKKIGRKIAIPTGFYGFSLYFCVWRRVFIVRKYIKGIAIGYLEFELVRNTHELNASCLSRIGDGHLLHLQMPDDILSPGLLHLHDGKPAFAQVFEAGTDVINLIIEQQEAVVAAQNVLPMPQYVC